MLDRGKEDRQWPTEPRVEVPAGLRWISGRFERWRSSHQGRLPIPERLWASAAEAAREHGVFRTAEVLRLEYGKLRRMAEATPSKRATAPPTTYLELMSPQAGLSECLVELEGPRGKMRVQWRGATGADLAGFSRVLWQSARFELRRRCAAWWRSRRWTAGKGIDSLARSCQEKLQADAFRGVCLFSPAGAGPRSGFWSTMGRDSGWHRTNYLHTTPPSVPGRHLEGLPATLPLDPRQPSTPTAASSSNVKPYDQRMA